MSSRILGVMFITDLGSEWADGYTVSTGPKRLSTYRARFTLTIF